MAILICYRHKNPDAIAQYESTNMFISLAFLQLYEPYTWSRRYFREEVIPWFFLRDTFTITITSTCGPFY